MHWNEATGSHQAGHGGGTQDHTGETESCICLAWQREGLGIYNYQVGGYRKQSVQSKSQWTWEAPVRYKEKKIILQKVKWWWNMTDPQTLQDLQCLEILKFWTCPWVTWSNCIGYVEVARVDGIWSFLPAYTILWVYDHFWFYSSRHCLSVVRHKFIFSILTKQPLLCSFS